MKLNSNIFSAHLKVVQSIRCFETPYENCPLGREAIQVRTTSAQKFVLEDFFSSRIKSNYFLWFLLKAYFIRNYNLEQHSKVHKKVNDEVSHKFLSIRCSASRSEFDCLIVYVSLFLNSFRT